MNAIIPIIPNLDEIQLCDFLCSSLRKPARKDDKHDEHDAGRNRSAIIAVPNRVKSKTTMTLDVIGSRSSPIEALHQVERGKDLSLSGEEKLLRWRVNSSPPST